MKESKIKILFAYDSMILGGSTTALLSLLNSLNPQKYDIALQLFRNEGPLLHCIPEHVRLLPEAEIHKGRKGKLIKVIKYVFTGNAFNALFRGTVQAKRLCFSGAVFADFQAKKLSRKNTERYNYAIGFLEGWSNRYIAYNTNAAKKYAWLHSTFANITSDPDLELPWMQRVDRIVFVTDACRNSFVETLPQMAKKTITVENITNSDVVRKRSIMIDSEDEAYQNFSESPFFKIVTVCRIVVNVKGLDRIVKCATQLKKRGYSFLWYIIGDGPDEAVLQALIRGAGVEDCVIAIGKRLNPYPFIAAANVMCMPSRYEGKPLVISESMILGIPPVVTEYLSAHEQIKNGIEGIVAENTDDSITYKLIQCMENDEELCKMQGYLRTQDYGNWESVRSLEDTLLF